MNEFYIADPTVCSSQRELGAFLKNFGPLTGRYLASFPIHWRNLVERHFQDLRVLEMEMIKSRIDDGFDSLALVKECDSIAWNQRQDWWSNVEPLLARDQIIFKTAISNEAKHPCVQSLDDLNNWAPTTGQKINGTTEEYVRATKVILNHGRELFLIDPYFNPFKTDRMSVLKAFLKQASLGRCQSFRIWARTSEINKTIPIAEFVDQLKYQLNILLKEINFNHRFKIEFNLVNDKSSKHKMHARYLFCIKGGVKFDQGFQILQKNEVMPIAKSVLNGLLNEFLDGCYDYKFDHASVVISV